MKFRVKEKGVVEIHNKRDLHRGGEVKKIESLDCQELKSFFQLHLLPNPVLDKNLIKLYHSITVQSEPLSKASAFRCAYCIVFDCPLMARKAFNTLMESIKSNQELLECHEALTSHSH